MVPSPWERRSFLGGMRQGGAAAREISSGNQVQLGQYGATSRTCSSFSLILHSVCAIRLTGGTHICIKPEPSYVLVHLCQGGSRSGRNTAGNWRTRGKQTGLPELLRIDYRSAGLSRYGVAILVGTWAVVRAHRLHAKKRDPLHWHEFALFSVDPKTQLAEVPVCAHLLTRLCKSLR